MCDMIRWSAARRLLSRNGSNTSDAQDIQNRVMITAQELIDILYDTTPISDFTFIFNIIFVIMCFVLGSRLTPFPIPFIICRCASRQLAAAALAVVSLNFQPSLSSPSPFHNSFCHTIITSTLIATVFVVDVVVCVNK